LDCRQWSFVWIFSFFFLSWQLKYLVVLFLFVALSLADLCSQLWLSKRKFIFFVINDAFNSENISPNYIKNLRLTLVARPKCNIVISWSILIYWSMSSKEHEGSHSLACVYLLLFFSNYIYIC
jgi:hypothetical protein